jgi:hypothetical protein
MQASSRVPVSLKNKNLLERSKYMKKIIFIISSLMMSLAMLIVSSPKTYASPTWNNVYIFDAFNETKDTTSLSIEEGTNIFTVNGNATSIKTYILPNLYDQNVNGSQLDSTKSYLIWYEYISGSVTTSTSAVTAIDTGANSDYPRSIRNVSTDYQVNKGYVIPPNGVSLSQVTLSANATAVNL